MQRREANPFRARRAIVVEIEPRMIYQNGEAAADQHHEKHEIKKVRPAKPPRKAMHACESSCVELGNRSEVWKAINRCLRPSHDKRNQCETDSNRNKGRFDPNAKPPIRRVMDGLMRCVECNHRSDPQCKQYLKSFSHCGDIYHGGPSVAAGNVKQRWCNMAYVIAEPCIGVKDTACVYACPVDCIHPGKNEADFNSESQLYI